MAESIISVLPVSSIQYGRLLHYGNGNVLAPHSFLPISGYGAIGNLRTVALVGMNGSIDWCCFPHIDDAAVFAAILDRSRGGRFQVAPLGPWQSEQHYWRGTNILETTFRTPTGVLSVVDWMPLHGDLDGRGRSHGAPIVHRLIRAKEGALTAEMCWIPRHDYARQKTNIRRTAGGYLAEAGSAQLTLTLDQIEAMLVEVANGPGVCSRFDLQAGRWLLLTTRWGTKSASCDRDSALATLNETTEAWRRWLHKPGSDEIREWTAAGTEMVERSELALKLLTHGDSGAVLAAATASLPEDIGGVRNWDYRYSWIRDSGQMVEAFLDFGHVAEARDLLMFVRDSSDYRVRQGKSPSIAYRWDGSDRSTQVELKHFEGYRQSRPVHVGNHAFTQHQFDIFGQILNAAYELSRYDDQLDEQVMQFLSYVADDCCDHWHKRDHGIWEMPVAKQHYVYTNVMSWVALDRAIDLATRRGLKGNVARWRRERERICNAVLKHGYNERVRAFTATFETDELDAATLLIPLLEFLPFDDPRVQSTIKSVQQELVENGLVYRYRMDDGLPGEEGTFGLYTFWLADALAFSGRADVGREYFETMLRHANHLGLFSEEIDPRTGEHLGNFPQAFTHIGLIDTAIHLAYVEKDDAPIRPPIGSPQHRHERQPV